MSEQFDKEDYSEYFAALEKQIVSGAEDKEKKPDFTQNNIEQPVYKQEKHRKHRKRINIKAVSLLCLCVCLAAVLIVVATNIPKGKKGKNAEQKVPDVPKITEEPPEIPKYEFNLKYTDSSKQSTQSMNSESYIFAELSSGEVLSCLNSKTRMYPASTTKIMTLLVAMEQIADLNETYVFTNDFLYPLYRENATVAGFLDGEEVCLTDILYGLILPSGGDAAIGLARKISGSEEEFVKLMNEKAAELGLENTHFTNVTGLHDANHYTTVEDMAVILAHTVQNELSRKILSTYQYTCTPTDKHPEGLKLTSTLFSYMYGTEPEGANITGGKTGFVNEAKYCIASFGESEISGKEYLCVTFKARSKYPAVYDHIHLFTEFAK